MLEENVVQEVKKTSVITSFFIILGGVMLALLLHSVLSAVTVFLMLIICLIPIIGKFASTLLFFRGDAGLGLLTYVPVVITCAIISKITKRHGTILKITGWILVITYIIAIICNIILDFDFKQIISYILCMGCLFTYFADWE